MQEEETHISFFLNLSSNSAAADLLSYDSLGFLWLLLNGQQKVLLFQGRKGIISSQLVSRYTT